MVLTIFTANCGEDFIADEKIQSFSTKKYLDGYPRDMDCWWNIKSQSANDMIRVTSSTAEKVQVTFESPVCFCYSVGAFFSFLHLF